LNDPLSVNAKLLLTISYVPADDVFSAAVDRDPANLGVSPFKLPET
jgi:hypothetical protein